MRRFGVAIGGLVAVAVLVPGSASARNVPGSAFARSIERDLKRVTGVQVILASCPSHVKLAKNSSFICNVEFVSGDQSPVKLTIRNSSGQYKAALQQVLLRHLEDQIFDKLDVASVTCPKKRKVKTGDTFKCTTIGPDETVVVTQTGGGGVTFEATVPAGG